MRPALRTFKLQEKLPSESTGPSKCFILLFLLVVWNPWAHKAMTMSDFGDEEVCTLHNYYFYVFLQVTS